jgi:hypothetical protein
MTIDSITVLPETLARLGKIAEDLNVTIFPVEKAKATVPQPISIDPPSVVIAENKKEKIMADIVTGTVTGAVDVSSLLEGQSDIRREQEQIGSSVRREQEAIGSTIRREQAKEASDTNTYVRETGWKVNDNVSDSTSKVLAQDTAYFIANQSQNFSNATALAALKASTDASFAQTLAAIQLSASQTTAAAQLAGEKSAAAAALGQAVIGQQIVQDGMLTRALINQQTVDELRFSKMEEKFEHRGHGHGCCGEKREGTITYGVPVTATYPV